MSLAKIDAFLSPVVKEACSILNLRENDGGVKNFDPVVASCARQAFSAIRSFTKREWLRSTWSEIYQTVPGESFSLRNVPVHSLVEVKIYVSDQEMAAEDYSLLGDYLEIKPLSDDLQNVEDAEFLVKVRYDGGLSSALEDVALLEALVQQTVANYNRRNLLGIRTLSGNALVDSTSGTVALDADPAGILPSVRTILADKVYYRWWRPA